MVHWPNRLTARLEPAFHPGKQGCGTAVALSSCVQALRVLSAGCFPPAERNSLRVTSLGGIRFDTGGPAGCMNRGRVSEGDT